MSLQEELETLRKSRDDISGKIADLHRQIKVEDNTTKGKSVSKSVVFPVVRDFNCLIGPNWSLSDIKTIFGIEHTDTKNSQFPNVFGKCDIYDILVASGAFESKSQARKNWHGEKEIAYGYSEIGPIGKSKLWIFIWSPTEEYVC